MPTYTVHDAKTNLSKLIGQAEAGEEVIITRSDQTADRLVPVDRKAPQASILCLQRQGRCDRCLLRAVVRERVGRVGEGERDASSMTRGQRMKPLRDTHALIRWLDGDRLLSSQVRRAIEDEDTEVLVSAAPGRDPRIDQSQIRWLGQRLLRRHGHTSPDRHCSGTDGMNWGLGLSRPSRSASSSAWSA